MTAKPSFAQQRRDLATIRSLWSSGKHPKPVERDYLAKSIAAIDETLAFNEQHEAEFRAWYREKHGREA